MCVYIDICFDEQEASDHRARLSNLFGDLLSFTPLHSKAQGWTSYIIHRMQPHTNCRGHNFWLLALRATARRHGISECIQVHKLYEIRKSPAPAVHESWIHSGAERIGTLSQRWYIYIYTYIYMYILFQRCTRQRFKFRHLRSTHIYTRICI